MYFSCISCIHRVAILARVVFLGVLVYRYAHPEGGIAMHFGCVGQGRALVGRVYASHAGRVGIHGK